MGILADITARFDASSAQTARADIDSLTGAVPAAGAALGGLEMAAAALANPLIALGLAVAAAVVGIGAMGMAAISAADDLRDMGLGSGTATEELQALQAVAEKSGGSLESLNSGLQFISRGLAKGGEETQKFTKALEYFGVKQEDANGIMKSAEQIAEEVAKAYAETENSASKSAAAADALGNGYKKLIPSYLEIGNKQDELNFLQEVGAVTTKELQDASDEYNDTMTDNGNIMKGLGNYAASSMIPLMQGLASQFKESATNGGLLEGAMGALKVVFSTVIGVGKVLATTFIGIDTIFQAVGKTIGGFAAATVALFKGDFTGAKNIMKNMDDDIKNTAAGAGERLKKMWTSIGSETKKAGDEAENTAKKINRGTYRSTNEKADKEIKVKVKVEKETDIEKADKALQGLIDSLVQANTMTETGSKYETVLAQLQQDRYKAGTEAVKEKVKALALENDQLTQNKALEDSLRDFAKSNRDTIQGLDDELKSRTMTTAAYKEYIATRKIDEDAAARIEKLNKNIEGFDSRRAQLLEEASAAKQKLIDKNVELAASDADWATGANQALMDFNAKTADVASQTREVMSNAFQGAEDALVSLVTTGKADFKGLAQSIIADLARMAIRALMTKAIMSFFGGGFAQGGVVAPSGGAVSNELFAAGDVLQRRTTFPMANGGQGEAGENGPEAIMPLKRLPNGRLGVEGGGSGGGPTIDVGGIYVTVQGSGGSGSNSKNDEEMATKIGNTIELRMKSLINSELRNQSRPGNQLNPTRVSGAF